MADAHNHATGGTERSLKIALALTAAFLTVELIGGIVTQSLALISDAAHMFTDVAALGIALAAIRIAKRVADKRRTFGYHRFEILAAAFNAMLLFGVAVYIVYEAYLRLKAPAEIQSTGMLAIAVAGLVVNLISMRVLAAGRGSSLNVKGAYLEVWSDMLGSVGVIVAAIVWGITNWTWVDPVIGAAIGLFILPRAWKLGRQALRVLVQAAPEGLDVQALQAELAAITGVVDVHDLHVWTLTSDMEVATAHLMVAVGTDHHAVLDEARTLLADHHGITHATLQVEPDDHHGCDELTW